MQLENNNNRSESLLRQQLMEEEEIERVRLHKIARDKKVRLELQKKYGKDKEQSEHSQANRNKSRDLEEERQRLQSIKQAHIELEKIQRLRMMEEEKYLKIKKDRLEEESFLLSQKEPSIQTKSRKMNSKRTENERSPSISIIDEKNIEDSPISKKKEGVKAT